MHAVECTDCIPAYPVRRNSSSPMWLRKKLLGKFLGNKSYWPQIYLLLNQKLTLLWLNFLLILPNKKIFLWVFFDCRMTFLFSNVFGLWMVLKTCWSKLNVTHISPKCSASIEHTITSFFVAFWLVLPFRERNYFLKNKTFYCIVFTNFPHKKYILFKISASYLFLHFLKNSQISASMFWQNIFLFKKC